MRLEELLREKLTMIDRALVALERRRHETGPAQPDAFQGLVAELSTARAKLISQLVTRNTSRKVHADPLADEIRRTIAAFDAPQVAPPDVVSIAKHVLSLAGDENFPIDPE